VTALRSLGLPADLPTALVARRPDLVAARWRAEAASERIDVAHAAFYPNVNLVGLIGVQSLGIGNLADAGSDLGSAGAVLGLPIFDGGRRKAGFKVARADYDAAVAAYDGTLNLALEEVADAVTSQRALEQRLADSREARDAATLGWRLAKRRYTAGASDFTAVLVAEDRMLSAQRTVSALESRRFILDLALVRALGGGWREVRRDLSTAHAPRTAGRNGRPGPLPDRQDRRARDPRGRDQRADRRDRGLCRRRRGRPHLPRDDAAHASDVSRARPCLCLSELRDLVDAERLQRGGGDRGRGADPGAGAAGGDRDHAGQSRDGETARPGARAGAAARRCRSVPGPTDWICANRVRCGWRTATAPPARSVRASDRHHQGGRPPVAVLCAGSPFVSGTRALKCHKPLPDIVAPNLSVVFCG
jgi:hypothetical protein